MIMLQLQYGSGGEKQCVCTQVLYFLFINWRISCFQYFCFYCITYQIKYCKYCIFIPLHTLTISAIWLFENSRSSKDFIHLELVGEAARMGMQCSVVRHQNTVHGQSGWHSPCSD